MSRSSARSRRRRACPRACWATRRSDGWRRAAPPTSSSSTTPSRSFAPSSGVRRLSPAENGAEPGTRFLAEIREQPAALRRLLEQAAEIGRIAAIVRARDARLVRIVGHGSSDNAASFGIYAFGLLPRWTAMRDSITLTVHYGTPLDMSGSTVIGLSQSGQTPDVVDYIRGARKTGAFTIAVTNDVASELATAADVAIPLAAEPELAVAATKTYVNTLATLALLAAHLAGRGPEVSDGIRRASEQLDEVIPSLER